MPAAPRVDPFAHFSADEWAALTARSTWRGLWLVVHCWSVIGLAMAAAWLWPATIPLAIVVVGTRQLGLFVLMHDGAHALLHADRATNDRVTAWFCSSTLARYRPYHLKHHRFVQQDEDPDLVLSAPFPITPRSFARKVTRDLTGRTFWKQRIAPMGTRVRDGLAARAPGASRARAVVAAVCGALAEDRAFLVGNGIGFAVFAAFGVGWLWLVCWLLPMATWLPLVFRVRNIAEHALVSTNERDPLRQARTTRAGWFERALVAPYWVNFHGEHHLFTAIPCWNLPKAHALLAARGTTAAMEVRPGYFAVLRLAAPRAA